MRGLLVAILAATMLSGCAAAPERERNMLIGAGVGAGVGALIGSASGPPGMWTGAVIGAASGGVIGYFVKNNACYFRNKRGEVWQVACEDPRVKAEGCFVGNSTSNLSEVPCGRRS